MFRNLILMGVAHAPGIRLLRQSVAATKFLAILFLILTENISCISCGSPKTINTASDGYASWAATRAGVVGGPLAVPTAVAAGVDTHRLAKRMDLELCLGKFEIHKNTIIRTGESQTLGGKYLQGLELDTAEECQRLCCETEFCDVYVFEDKSDGYCYLFECGPPENFHCKFTRHANYTSAVLTVARHVTEVTTTKPSVAHAASTNNISQQEWELTSLKVKPETHDKTSVATGMGGVEGAVSGVSAAGSAVSVSANVVATESPVQMLGVEQIPPLSVAFPQKVYAAHCGRFQFSCHSGECIAVYNACDGIPQCEDGSDEGPECSAATSTAKSNADVGSANAMELKIPLKTQYQLPLVQPQLQSVHQVEQTQQKQQQQQSMLQTLPGVVPPLINNREDAGAWANRKTAISDANHSEQAANDVDLNSRIFSHKGGIQVPTTGVNANNNPNSGMVNSYSNTNNNNNPNLSLNPVYNAAALQHGGIYLPPMADLSKGGVYVPQQQQLVPQQQQQPQYLVPQGHMMLPPNVQWQMQQQLQPQPQQQQQQVVPQQQPHQSPPQLQQQILPMPLQPGPAYIVTAAEQQQQQPAAAPTDKATKAVTAIATNVSTAAHAEKTALQQQPQTVVQQSTAQVAAASTKAVHGATAQKLDESKVASKTAGTHAVAEEEYDESGEEEKPTEAPKKKHKHKKLAAIEKANAKKKPQLDPIESALEEQRQRAPAPLPVHEQYRMIHENLGLEFRDHDGQSERPGGAMLSLTLGLLVTAALAILIGCRMRTVSRRTRRMGGKTPYSHEADFLVNGMYL